MNTCYFATKGGQGTTTTAAADAIASAAKGIKTLLVDYRGDAAAVLGMPEIEVGMVGVGVSAGDHLRVLRADPARINHPSAQLPFAERYVFDVDAADVASICARWDAAPVTVLRPCYVALRRVPTGPLPTGAVLIAEPGRALDATDVAAVVGVPVRVLPFEPAVARAVDSGLLASRLPRALLKALDSVPV